MTQATGNPFGSLLAAMPGIGSVLALGPDGRASINVEGPHLALALPIDGARADALLKPLGLIAYRPGQGPAMVYLGAEKHFINQVHTFTEFYATIPGIRFEGTTPVLVSRFDHAITPDLPFMTAFGLSCGFKFRHGSVAIEVGQSAPGGPEAGSARIEESGQLLVSFQMAGRPIADFEPRNISNHFEYVPAGIEAPIYYSGTVLGYGYAAPWDPARDRLDLGPKMAAYLGQLGYLGKPLEWTFYPYFRTRSIVWPPPILQALKTTP